MVDLITNRKKTFSSLTFVADQKPAVLVSGLLGLFLADWGLRLKSL